MQIDKTLWKTVWRYLVHWIWYMICNPAFPLLSIFPKESCACVPQVLRAALLFNSKILWIMFIDRKVSKTSKTKYISRMPIYEVKKHFLKQQREEKREILIPNICRLHAPEGGACLSPLECRLDLVTQLQIVECRKYSVCKKNVFHSVW